MNNDTLDQQIDSSTPKYVGFGPRLAAHLIDVIIFTTISYFIWGSEIVDTYNGFHVHFNNEKVLIPVGYMFLFWLSLSTTPGKLIFGIKIVDENGRKIKALHAFLRILGYIILPIGCWFILGNDKKQALHDKIANTFVVKA